MFKRPTVFILGAGASWHYGYPTGEGLVKGVVEKCKIAKNFFAQLPMRQDLLPNFIAERVPASVLDDEMHRNAAVMAAHEHVQRLCENLERQLIEVDPPVIDYFLGQNRSLQDIGRLFIAWVLRECETHHARTGRNLNRSAQSEGMNDNWYRFILHRMTAGCGNSEELLKNNVSFVTFNYDMSLEDYIERGLSNIRMFQNRDIARFMREGRFTHVYGKIRNGPGAHFEELNTSVYVPDNTAEENYRREPELRERHWKMLLDDAYAASKFIRTVDPHDKYDEDTFRRARQAIEKAECIYILGFGFDMNNCVRLGLNQALKWDAGEKTCKRSIQFTNFNDVNRINRLVSQLWLEEPDQFAKSTTCGKGRCQYYKSVHDCYGAMAHDFEEVEER